MRTFSLPCPAPFWQMSSIEIDRSKGLCEVEFGEVEDGKLLDFVEGFRNGSR